MTSRSTDAPAVHRVREQLIHLQRVVSDALLGLGSEATHSNDARPPSRVMTVSQYAAYRAVSKRTVYRWISLGLPVERRGKITRIVVTSADAWDERAAIARHAEIAASGGSSS